MSPDVVLAERSQQTGAVDLCLRYDRGTLEQVMPRVCGGAKGKPCDQGPSVMPFYLCHRGSRWR